MSVPNERFLDTRSARCGEMQDRRRDPMGRQTGSRRAHRVAAPLETRATDNPPDYRDAFEVPTDRTDTRTPEQWARAVFESAPREVALVPSAGVAGGAGLADRRNVARGGPSRTALGVDDRLPDPARGKLDGRLGHQRAARCWDHESARSRQGGRSTQVRSGVDDAGLRLRGLGRTGHRLQTVRSHLLEALPN